MPISDALKRVYASAPADRRYIETLSFSHSRFTQSYYFVNDLRDWTFSLETAQLQTFQRFPFRIVLPTQDRQGNQDLQIAVSNVGRELMDEIRAANEDPSEPIACVLRIYLDLPGTTPENNPPLSLTITDVEASRETVTAVARRADILNRPFPRRVYRIDEFPGLER